MAETKCLARSVLFHCGLDDREPFSNLGTMGTASLEFMGKAGTSYPPTPSLAGFQVVSLVKLNC